MPDFSKTWASNSPLPAYTFTDSDYLEGWDFIGAAPPTKNQFDAWFKQTDEKLKWLYDKLNDTANAIYPVGAVYISFVSTSPASLFGGTWQRLKDTFLLANGDNYAANTTGGAATKTITVNNLPAHNHTVNASTHSHSATTAGSGSHTHTASSNTTGAHKHERGTMNIVGTITNDSGADEEYLTYADAITSTGALRVGKYGTTKGAVSGTTGGAYNEISFDASRNGAWTGETSSAGSHTHTITVISVGNHTHTVTINNGGSHTHTTNNTGGSQPLNILPPYTTVYMWKRTA